MRLVRTSVAVAALLACAAFTSDSAGRACVARKGERGVAYDIHRTKVTDAYSPNGRRLVENGHRVYDVEVPPLTKRDKPIQCRMRLDSELWRLPSKNPFDDSPFSPRETRESNWW